MKDTEQEQKTISIEAFNVFYQNCQEKIIQRLELPFSGGFSQEMSDRLYHQFLEQYKQVQDVDATVEWYFSNLKPVNMTENEKKAISKFLKDKKDD